MLITEYRIPLPLTLQEFQIGQLYATIEMSKNETGGGEGIEILRNEPFCNLTTMPNQHDSGQYTYKLYHLSKKIPNFVQNLTPRGTIVIHEESWNAFPFCKTELKYPDYLDEGFSISIQTRYCEDNGIQDNVHGLSNDLLKRRHIVYIDIVNDPMEDNSEYNPSKFKSVKTGRGPFVGNWRETAEPIMTCYKLVMIEFKWYGLQTRIEKLIHSTEKKIFFLFHRMLLCLMDKWYGLSIEDVRKIEKQGAIDLHKTRFEGDVRGLIVLN